MSAHQTGIYMADFDFLDGFDTGGDWGFSSVAEKPSEKATLKIKGKFEIKLLY